jgi:hypothetical protein
MTARAGQVAGTAAPGVSDAHISCAAGASDAHGMAVSDVR